MGRVVGVLRACALPTVLSTRITTIVRKFSESHGKNLSSASKVMLLADDGPGLTFPAHELR
jgi:hypothetical protein